MRLKKEFEETEEQEDCGQGFGEVILPDTPSPGGWKTMTPWP